PANRRAIASRPCWAACSRPIALRTPSESFAVYIDSHCHLDFPDLAGRIDEVLTRMTENSVDAAMCIAVNMEDFPSVLALADAHPRLWATVGVHPDYQEVDEPDVDRLVRLAEHPRILAIGETGLDYYRL